MSGTITIDRSFWRWPALCLACLLGLLAVPTLAAAELRMPHVFTDHMVLQREQPNRVWGWAEPGAAVEVRLADQQHSAKADASGRWEVELAPLEAGGPYQLEVRSGAQAVRCEDVLVGEVWICSGQSNMAFAVQSARDSDLEVLTADLPQVRLLSVPQVGTQEPQTDFAGQWKVCTPENVESFSAVGFFFGRRLHRSLGVPIGLIDNAWGGSACEAWIRPDLLTADPRYAGLLEYWEALAADYDHASVVARYEDRLANWQKAARAARQAGKQPPPRPRAPRNPLTGQHRPGNLYCGVLHPLIGYGIRGAIWYQGEANATRGYQYRHLFPLMIEHWRQEWGQGPFPFYWVQLADFKNEVDEPAESDWAELREAQTMTMARLPNTGQAVIIDLGEGKDIHPRNKQDVAKRLARWALARDYGMDIAYRSPTLVSYEQQGKRIRLTFDIGGEGSASSPLTTLDTRELHGFTIAGEDRAFRRAEARLIDEKTVEVWDAELDEPVAVRYAWADNPRANLYNRAGLPVTPFRTDDWPGVTVGVDHR